MPNKNAFSVFELLITILVLGFGYSLIMPHILNYTKVSKTDKTTSAYEMAYDAQKSTAATTLMQVISSAAMENGGSLQGICSSNDCFADLLSIKLSSMNKCGSSNTTQCWATNTVSGSGLVLASGVLVLITSTDANCTNNACAKISIDVNGFKPPNTRGNDIFQGNITVNSLSGLN